MAAVGRVSLERLVDSVNETSATNARLLALAAATPTVVILCIALVWGGVLVGLPIYVAYVANGIVIAWFLIRVLRLSFVQLDDPSGTLVVRNIFRTYKFDGLADGNNIKYRGLRVIGPASVLFVRTSVGRWVPILRLLPARLEDIQKT